MQTEIDEIVDDVEKFRESCFSAAEKILEIVVQTGEYNLVSGIPVSISSYIDRMVNSYRESGEVLVISGGGFEYYLTDLVKDYCKVMDSTNT